MAEISVITAFRGTEHLEQTLRSLVAQSISDWEWVLVPTNDRPIPAGVRKSKKVRVVADPEVAGDLNLARVRGAREASAPILLHLEEGEALTPDALESVLASLADDGTDIVYCDFALFPIKGRPVPDYIEAYGWVSDTMEFDGETLRTLEAFDPIPSALGHASYAPRHGLAMSKQTYLDLGGHDQLYGNASTFALVCSSYLAGMRYTRIAKVLVCSRFTEMVRRDTYLEKVIADASLMPIVHEWSRRNELSMLDLGAAHNPAPGFVSVDLQDATINCDIRFGLPLPDDSVGVIRAHDFLEHMNTCPDSSCTHGADGVGPRCVVGIMNEFHRVLAPGGWLLTHTPSTDGRGAFQDPTHTSYWNPNSFWYYTRADQARFVRGLDCRFQMARLWQGFPSRWHQENNLVYVDADLIALKGQKQPGICEI